MRMQGDADNEPVADRRLEDGRDPAVDEATEPGASSPLIDFTQA